MIISHCSVLNSGQFLLWYFTHYKYTCGWCGPDSRNWSKNHSALILRIWLCCLIHNSGSESKGIIHVHKFPIWLAGCTGKITWNLADNHIYFSLISPKSQTACTWQLQFQSTQWATGLTYTPWVPNIQTPCTFTFLLGYANVVFQRVDRRIRVWRFVA